MAEIILRGWRFRLIITLIMLMFFPAVLPGPALSKSPSNPIGLTVEELRWIQDHPVIRVHNEMSWAPINFNRYGNPTGFSIDMMNLVAKKTGLKIAYQTGSSWDEYIVQIKEKKLDVMLNIVNSAKRREFLEFTDPYLEFSQALYTRKGFPRVDSISDLAGKRFAVPRGFYVEELLKAHPEVVVVSVEDTAAAIRAVSNSEADVLLDVMPVVNYLARSMLVTNLQPGGRIGFDEDQVFKLSLGVRKDWKTLRDILQKGLAAVTERELREIQGRWFAEVKSEPVNTVTLSQSEKLWLEKHPVIRVSSELDYAPFDFVKDGKPAGFSIDYLNLVAERAGLKLEYAQDTWNNLLEKAKKKELDLLHTIFYTPERTEFLLYTKPYKSIVNFIYAQAGESSIDSLQDLAHRKVALPKGDSIVDFLPSIVPEVRIVYMDSYLDILKALSLGKAEATVMDGAVANYLIRENTLTNIKPIAEAKINPGDRDPRYRLAVRKDWPELHAILEKSAATITQGDMARLESRWFGLTRVWKRTSVELTPEESEWLEKNLVIRVHNEKEWPPFNYFEYGKPRGLSIDYMNLLAEKLGITVEYVTGPNWAEFIDRLKNKRLDVMLNIVKTEEREAFVLFTPPYIKNPNVIVSREGEPFQSLEKLKGKTVAAPRGFFHHEIIGREFPEIKLLETDDQLTALKAVGFNNADATVGEKAVVEHLIRKNLLTGLSISGEILLDQPEVTNLRIGVRKDWPLLQSILTKAMGEVTPQEMHTIRENWIIESRLEEDAADDSILPYKGKYLLPLLGIVVAVGAVLLLASWLISGTRKRDISEIYNSRELRRAGLLIIALSIGLIILLAVIRLNQFKQDIELETRARLREALGATHQSLRIWALDRKRELQMIIESPELRELVNGVVQASYRGKDVLNGVAQKELQHYFEKRKRQYGRLAYYILSPDMAIIGAHDHRAIGKKLTLGGGRKKLLDTVFLGEYQIVPPFKSRLIRTETDGSQDSERAAMLFGGPVIDESGMVRAIFALAFHPASTLSDITHAGILGASGETYLFDSKGVLLSESRFTNTIREMGLLQAGQSSVLNIRLADPGRPFSPELKGRFDAKSAPLTYMADRATRYNDGTNIDGYRDYRGIIVVGAWLWDPDLHIGMTTEMDLDEAFLQYTTMRNTLVITLGSAVLIALLLTGFSIWIGQSANRSLVRSRDELEIRVAERTAELTRLEKRFRDLLESAPDSMIIVDDGGIITIINEQTEKLFGYSREELVGQPIEVVVPERFREDHPDKRNGFIELSKRDPIKVSRELIGRKKNGEEFPADISLNPLQTEEGLLVSAAVRDITDRIEAQEALRESEERNRLVLDSVGEGIFGVNMDGRIMFINPAACSILGYTHEELLDEKIHDLIHHTRKDGSHYPVDECPMKKAYVEGNTYSIDDEVLWKKDGSPVDVYYTSTPIIQDDLIEGAVITFRDVTEKRLAEEELKASESRFRGYFEYGQVGMSVTDPEKGWLEVNKRFTDMLGYSFEELKQLTWADLTYKDDLEADMANFKKIMAGEISNYSMDKRFVRKDGDLVFVNLSVACIRDENGKVEKLLASMLDITEAKSNEAELTRRFDELERFRRLATGRELKMISLKEEINALLVSHGGIDKYKIHKPGGEGGESS